MSKNRPELTARQRQVVTLIAQGLSTKQVAVALAIEIRTAATHRAQLMERLDVHSTAALVHYAIRSGLTKVLDLRGVR